MVSKCVEHRRSRTLMAVALAFVIVGCGAKESTTSTGASGAPQPGSSPPATTGTNSCPNTDITITTEPDSTDTTAPPIGAAPSRYENSASPRAQLAQAPTQTTLITSTYPTYPTTLVLPETTTMYPIETTTGVPYPYPPPPSSDMPPTSIDTPVPLPAGPTTSATVKPIAPDGAIPPTSALPFEPPGTEVPLPPLANCSSYHSDEVAFRVPPLGTSVVSVGLTFMSTTGEGYGAFAGREPFMHALFFVSHDGIDVFASLEIDSAKSQLVGPTVETLDSVLADKNATAKGRRFDATIWTYEISTGPLTGFTASIWDIPSVGRISVVGRGEQMSQDDAFSVLNQLDLKALLGIDPSK